MTRRAKENSDSSSGSVSPSNDWGREIIKRFRGGINGMIIFWGMVLCVSSAFLWSAFSGPQGIFSLAKQKRDAERIEADNRSILLQNQEFRKQIYLLKKSPEYIEKTAREELGYIRKGEKVYLSNDDLPPRISEPEP